MSLIFIALIQFAILAYALIGGVFLAFSDFIMRSLAHTRGTGGLEAMQIINREVFRWVFMSLFLGMTIVSLIITVYAAFYLEAPAATLITASGLVYLIGCFGITVLFNVPMNEALASMDSGSTTAKEYWTKTYLPRWTLWNTIRTIACVLSAAMLLSGLSWMATMQAVHP